MMREGRIRSLLDQAPQLDLAGALEVGLAALQRDDVGKRHLELEDLLGGDDPLARWDGGGEAVEQCRLAGLESTGHQDVEAAHDRCPEGQMSGRMLGRVVSR
jgi:hypothetical protein